MDSLSQIVLGAAVGQAIAGKKMGRKAALWGAIAGTIPDLDILFIPKSDPLGYLLIHRSYSHAFLPLIMAAFLFAWITFVVYRKKHSYKDWYLLWLGGLITHPMLDSLTTYGTRLFLPFTDYLVSTHSISIIDPLYTIPFLVLVVIGLCYKKDNPKSQFWNTLALVISTGYLVFALGVKVYVDGIFSKQLKEQGIVVDKNMTGPTILNTMLWFGVATNQDSIYTGEYSLLQTDPNIKFVRYARNLPLVENHPAADKIKPLKWFSTGYYFAENNKDTLNFYNIKFGRMDYEKTKPVETFLFYYKVYKDANGVWTVGVKEPDGIEGGLSNALKKLWARILGKSVPEQ